MFKREFQLNWLTWRTEVGDASVGGDAGADNDENFLDGAEDSPHSEGVEDALTSRPAGHTSEQTRLASSRSRGVGGASRTVEGTTANDGSRSRSRFVGGRSLGVDGRNLNVDSPATNADDRRRTVDRRSLGVDGRTLNVDSLSRSRRFDGRNLFVVIRNLPAAKNVPPLSNANT